MSTNRSIPCALVHECIKDSEKNTSNFLNNIWQNIVIKCLLKKVHYVHPFNVQIVEIVHTYRLYAGKMMGPILLPIRTWRHGVTQAVVGSVNRIFVPRCVFLSCLDSPHVT